MPARWPRSAYWPVDGAAVGSARRMPGAGSLLSCGMRSCWPRRPTSCRSRPRWLPTEHGPGGSTSDRSACACSVRRSSSKAPCWPSSSRGGTGFMVRISGPPSSAAGRCFWPPSTSTPITSNRECSCLDSTSSGRGPQLRACGRFASCTSRTFRRRESGLTRRRRCAWGFHSIPTSSSSPATTSRTPSASPRNSRPRRTCAVSWRGSGSGRPSACSRPRATWGRLAASSSRARRCDACPTGRRASIFRAAARCRLPGSHGAAAARGIRRSSAGFCPWLPRPTTGSSSLTLPISSPPCPRTSISRSPAIPTAVRW